MKPYVIYQLERTLRKNGNRLYTMDYSPIDTGSVSEHDTEAEASEALNALKPRCCISRFGGDVKEIGFGLFKRILDEDGDEIDTEDLGGVSPDGIKADRNGMTYYEDDEE